MSGMIIYRSSYGSTKQYADWISEETGFKIFDSRAKDIPWNSETIVIGCPIIANKPVLLGWMQKHWDRLEGRNVVLFTTSGADPAEAPVDEWLAKALPEKMKDTVAVFPLAGKFVFDELNGPHKLMMRIGAILVRDEAIKHQIAHPVDGVARENLVPLLQHLQT